MYVDDAPAFGNFNEYISNWMGSFGKKRDRKLYGGVSRPTETFPDVLNLSYCLLRCLWK